MRVRAIKSFCGAVTLRRGQEADLTEQGVLEDLLRAGYIECLDTEDSLQMQEEAGQKSSKRGKKGSDGA